MRVIYDVLLEITAIFAAQHFPHPRRQAEEMLSELLACSRASFYHAEKQLLSEKEELICQEWTQRLLKGEPLAYLSGYVQFYECVLEITPAVLIPRPETEILVDKVATSLKKQDRQGKVLWDLCCGSGCIGIALKKKFPDLTVYLADASKKAIALAARNAKNNEVEVNCLAGDLLHPFVNNKAHYVVCNPPYISENEYMTLEKGVKNYEPRMALVAGKTGLEFYKRLALELPAYLHSDAQVWLEIGYQQGEAVQRIFQGFFLKKQRVENDWAGHPRFFSLENE